MRCQVPQPILSRRMWLARSVRTLLELAGSIDAFKICICASRGLNFATSEEVKFGVKTNLWHTCSCNFLNFLGKFFICLRKGIERACSNHCNQRDRCILPRRKTLPICWRRRAGGSLPACQHDAAILGSCFFWIVAKCLKVLRRIYKFGKFWGGRLGSGGCAEVKRTQTRVKVTFNSKIRRELSNFNMRDSLLVRS